MINSDFELWKRESTLLYQKWNFDRNLNNPYEAPEIIIDSYPKLVKAYGIIKSQLKEIQYINAFQEQIENHKARIMKSIRKALRSD